MWRQWSEAKAHCTESEVSLIECTARTVFATSTWEALIIAKYLFVSVSAVFFLTTTSRPWGNFSCFPVRNSQLASLLWTLKPRYGGQVDCCSNCASPKASLPQTATAFQNAENSSLQNSVLVVAAWKLWVGESCDVKDINNIHSTPGDNWIAQFWKWRHARSCRWRPQRDRQTAKFTAFH